MIVCNLGQILAFSLILNLISGYVNPVIDQDNPDPGALLLPDNTYVALTTTGNSDNALRINFSRDLVHWNIKGYVFEGKSKWP